MTRPTVLVVDDEPDIVFTVGMILEIAGYEVREASTGAGALAEIAREVPSIVVLDIGLPDMSGWDVLDRLRESGLLPGQPVVVLSAHVSSESAERAVELGCRAFVVKPFRNEELLRALERAMSAV